MPDSFLIQHDVSLAPLSTFAIGGMAKSLIAVHSPEELIKAVEWAKGNNQPFRIFAGGSNVVFPDEGLNDLVIHYLGGKYAGNMRELKVEAGVLLRDVVSYTISRGWRGMESLSGIPGTLGGAIVGNAGAYGHSIGEIVNRVEVYEEGRRRWISQKECQFAYRDSIFKHTSFLILGAIQVLGQGDASKLQEKSAEIITMREVKYHPGIKCPGSFFKNIVTSELKAEQLSRINKDKIKYGKIPAGYLLEEVGAKGMREGDIEIAPYHGNLFINLGRGTAAQVKVLASRLKNKVMERFGIELEEEIRYF